MRRPCASGMPVPEAAVDEDRQSGASEDYVGATRKVARMEPVADAMRPERTTEEHLGFGVAPSDPRHDLRSRQGSAALAHQQARPTGWARRRVVGMQEDMGRKRMTAGKGFIVLAAAAAIGAVAMMKEETRRDSPTKPSVARGVVQHGPASHRATTDVDNPFGDDAPRSSSSPVTVSDVGPTGSPEGAAHPSSEMGSVPVATSRRPSMAHEGLSCERTTCSRIATCEEARYRLDTCGQTRLDGDGDGIPCEKLCG